MTAVVALDGISNFKQTLPATSPYISLELVPKANTAKIEDDKGRLIAFGAIIRCTNNQAYFVLQHLDNEIAKKPITVCTPDVSLPFNIRIKDIFEKQTDRSFLPMYVQVHFNPEERFPIEHLIDLLAEKTLGNANLELRKNITIDLFDSDGDAFIRDKAGFIVGDRMRFEQITLDVSELDSSLIFSKEVRIIEKKSSFNELLEFDSTLSSQNRSEFLQLVFSKSVVLAAVRIDAQCTTEDNSKGPSIAGYIVISPNSFSHELNILCLYACNQEVAESLLKSSLKQSKAKKAVFCTSIGQWEKLRVLKSYYKRPIYRRHTRLVPANIKWEQIFALNVGMNLF